jgi:hypothetical protein
MKLHNQAFNRLLENYVDVAERESLRQEWMPHLKGLPIAVASRSIDHFIRDWRRIPTLAEFLEHAEVEASHQVTRKRHAEIEECPLCDKGHIVMQNEPFTVRPCHKCLPETYDAWATGRYEPSL